MLVVINNLQCKRNVLGNIIHR